jgi:hypothetical protein
LRPGELLQSLTRLHDEALELVICDGPDPGDDGAAQILGLVDEVVVFADRSGEASGQSLGKALAAAGITARARVWFETEAPQQQKRA